MEHLEQVIVDLKDGLERELASLEERLGQKIDGLSQRLDTQAARLERHGALLDAGGRAIVRTNAWAEKIDAALEAKDREIADLRERIARLERKSD